MASHASIQALVATAHRQSTPGGIGCAGSARRRAAGPRLPAPRGRLGTLDTRTLDFPLLRLPYAREEEKQGPFPLPLQRAVMRGITFPMTCGFVCCSCIAIVTTQDERAATGPPRGCSPDKEGLFLVTWFSQVILKDCRMRSS